MEEHKKKRLRKVLGLLLGLIILGFLIGTLYVSGNELLSHELQFNPWLIVLTFVVLSISPFLLTASWNYMLHSLNEKLSLIKIFNILNISHVIRYIPGNIWYVVGRTGMFKAKGISLLKAGIAFFAELSMLILSAFAIFLLSLALGFDSLNIPYVLLIPVALLIVVFLHPKVFNFLIKKGYKIYKKKDIETSWNFKTILRLFAIYVIHWVVQGVAFFLILISIYKVPIELIIPIIGIHSIAWILSFLTFISPAGLGVKEGLLALMLQTLIPLEIAIVVAILSRVVIIVHEGIFAGLSILFRRLE